MTSSLLPDGVRSTLRTFERRILALLLLFGSGRLLRVLAALLAALYAMDRLFEPPPWFRLGLAALGVFFLGRGALQNLMRPLRERPRKADLAALLERTHPGLEDRLATAIEIGHSHPGESSELKHAAAIEAEIWIEGIDLHQAAPAGSARRSALQGLAAAAVLLGAAWMQPAEARTFFDRLFGGASAWPRDTTLVLLPPFAAHSADPLELDQTAPERYRLLVAQGTSLTLRVRAHGEVPDRITAAGPLGERAMQPLGGGEFILRLPPLEEAARWTFRGGDDDDDLPLLVMEPGIAPAVTDWLVHTTPPASTGRPPADSSATEFRVPSGTHFEVRFASDLAVAEAALTTLDGRREVLSASADGSWNFALDADLSGERTIELTGHDGFRNGQAAVLRWHAEPDRAPRVDFVFPDQRWNTVAGAVVPITLDAGDDYGLAQVELNSGDADSAWSPQFPAGARSWQHFETWKVPAPSAEDFSMEFRVRIEAKVVDGAQPAAQSSAAQAPWIQVVPAEVFDENLADHMVRIRERIEDQLRRLQPLQDDATSLNPIPIARRLDRDLSGMLQDLERLLLERVYAGLDRGSLAVQPTLNALLALGAPSAGEITSALGGEGVSTLLDRSGLLLDLARAANQARTGPAQELRNSALEEGALGPPAAELALQLRSMLDILLAWEDFQSAVDLLRGLLDRQRTLYLRTQEASAR